MIKESKHFYPTDFNPLVLSGFETFNLNNCKLVGNASQCLNDNFLLILDKTQPLITHTLSVQTNNDKSSTTIIKSTLKTK